MKKIIECVPNFSEGRDKNIIDAITAEIEKGGEVKLLDVDPGEATNRTVVTFVGEPDAVMEAALRGMRKAAELIDMRHHHGAHPRMGATDVCPLIPVSGITLEECASLARELAERAAAELNIPCYCYEAAAFVPERKNLAICREGEYEGLAERMGKEGKGPDFGDRAFDEGVARTGCTAVGARDFLIAVNFNLNTTSTRRANAIAFDVREKGRPKREGGKPNGKPVKDENGNVIMLPGTLKSTKAIGWFIDEYGIAQVSMNITDMGVTPLHVAFDEVCRAAAARGIRVTGTEIVGLVPKRALLDAGLSTRQDIFHRLKSAGRNAAGFGSKLVNANIECFDLMLESKNHAEQRIPFRLILMSTFSMRSDRSVVHRPSREECSDDFRVNSVAGFEQSYLFDDILQLPDISRPPVTQQCSACRVVK